MDNKWTSYSTIVKRKQKYNKIYKEDTIACTINDHIYKHESSTTKHQKILDVRDLHISLHVHFRAKIDQSPKTGYTIFL